jgi:hypothetical protein
MRLVRLQTGTYALGFGISNRCLVLQIGVSIWSFFGGRYDPKSGLLVLTGERYQRGLAVSEHLSHLLRRVKCKLAFLAKLTRRRDSPWHFARTDIGCPHSRAKKCTLSFSKVANHETSWESLERRHALQTGPTPRRWVLFRCRQGNRRAENCCIRTSVSGKYI